MEYYRLSVPIPKAPWRWIQFRITTILLLFALVCMALAWHRDRTQLVAELHRLKYPATGWGADQAAGPPNTNGPGDFRTAWASQTQDDQEEWLLLNYNQSVVPTAIVIHETYNPGAVYKVTHVPIWGAEQTLWEGADPTPVGSAAGVSRLPVTEGIRTGRIKVYLDSPAVPGWNEIDAVGLEYGSGEVIWAGRAEASSSYGQDAFPVPLH